MSNPGPSTIPDPPNVIARVASVLGLLSVVLIFFTGLPALICGFVGLRRSRGRVECGRNEALVGIVLGTVSLFVTGPLVSIYILVPAARAVAQAKTAANDRMSAMQITLGYHNGLDLQSRDNDPFAAAREPRIDPFSDARHGSLSWRVPILPFIEQDNVYRSMRLNEPWDSPHNLKATRNPVGPFRSAADPKSETGTRWRGFTGPGTIFNGNQFSKIQTITDGTSNTLLFTDGPELSPWPMANDIPYSAKTPLPQFGHPRRTLVVVGMADGSIRIVHQSAAPESLWRALIVKDDNIRPPSDW